MLSEADLERNRDRPTAGLLAGVEERARHPRELLSGTAADPLLPEALTGDGWNADPPAREWLIDGWLPAGAACTPRSRHCAPTRARWCGPAGKMTAPGCWAGWYLTDPIPRPTNNRQVNGTGKVGASTNPFA